ncbi:polysaccharide lyase family 14 protein [Cylindrobasidium torrendii FP15055 ss-10]|uniref:Polysaccharide lyase family 14 protein n=1 Tax=Cylindrobasidium torrendii FP15055 ss-10 TaxID=1314674 RepID=A0A0D7BUD2_9AGAR|nr:polysaccharide lyase family 14 protein [Cylindrobasidium torrendii FP15055 ss-10]
MYPHKPLSSYYASPLDENSLASLNPTMIKQNPGITFGQSPDGESALVATYPQGSYTLNHGNGGFSFYLIPGADIVDLSNAREVTFTYSVFFEEGFDWNLGGKLPGLFGGDAVDSAASCSGGRQDGRSNCFSVRLMFRSGGAGELYVYLPPGQSQDYCGQPGNVCNAAYGDSLGRGAFSFTAGSWNTVTMRVRTNTVGQQDGEVELWVDGRSVLEQKGLVMITADNQKTLGMMMQTFFGGGSAKYASPKDQKAYFSGIAIAVTEV